MTVRRDWPRSLFRQWVFPDGAVPRPATMNAVLTGWQIVGHYLLLNEAKRRHELLLPPVTR